MKERFALEYKVSFLKHEVYQPLADCSRLFLKEKKVYRYRLKKISEMSGSEIIRACHFYVGENGLIEEWEAFRESNERQSDEGFCKE